MKTARTVVLGALGACLSLGCGARAVELLGLPARGAEDVVALGATALTSVVAAWYALTALALLLAQVATAGACGRPLAAALGRAVGAWGAPLLRGAAVAGVGITLGITPALAGQAVDDETGQAGPAATDVVDDTGVPLDLRPGFTALIVDEATPATSQAGLTKAPDVPTAAPPRDPSSPPDATSARGEQYVVQPGDSLWAISAAALGPGADDAQIAEAWPRWYETNRAVIGVNPHLIHPGQLLLAPEPEDRP